MESVTVLITTANAIQSRNEEHIDQCLPIPYPSCFYCPLGIHSEILILMSDHGGLICRTLMSYLDCLPSAVRSVQVGYMTKFPKSKSLHPKIFFGQLSRGFMGILLYSYLGHLQIIKIKKIKQIVHSSCHLQVWNWLLCLTKIQNKFDL